MDFDPNPTPVSDPAADGLPETADDDSHADEENDGVRIADGQSPYSAPPDREDGPLALEDFGNTAQERLDGEPLRRRLRREEPDLVAESVAIDPEPAMNTDTVLEQSLESIGEDADNLDGGEPVDPRLGSQISMYDRDVPGIPSLATVGRLTRPDGGWYDSSTDEVAFDAGIAGGRFSAEEAAMHEVPESDLLDQGGPGEPYLRERELGPLIRTGAEQPWDAEDLAVAQGHDPTPKNIERAQHELDELGAAAIEKTVP